MSHARIEEVSDSDDGGASDPSEGDIEEFDESNILVRRDGPKPSSGSTRPAASGGSRQQPLSSSTSGRQQAPFYELSDLDEHSTTLPVRPGGSGGIEPSSYSHYAMLYPVYFDATRSRAEGRRVPKSLAVVNPLARTITDACTQLRLMTVFEPAKAHPRDWGNPGRVRVQLRLSEAEEAARKKAGVKGPFVPGHVPGETGVKNKHHLYLLVARYLVAHPTKEHDAALRMRVPGVPLPDPSKPWPRPAVPRGWKIGELLPAWSPALTGGGVSENLFKDMMNEMQGKAGPGTAGADIMSGMLESLQGGGSSAGGADESGGGKKKKDKKGKGKG